MKTFTSLDLAREFARLVRERFTSAELVEVNRRNDTLGYARCCATHDFCDANMLMLDACANLSSVPQDQHDFGDEALCAKVNEAWDLAKAARFQERILTDPLAIARRKAGRKGPKVAWQRET